MHILLGMHVPGIVGSWSRDGGLTLRPSPVDGLHQVVACLVQHSELSTHTTNMQKTNKQIVGTMHAFLILLAL